VSEAYILSAIRTPVGIGKPGGALAAFAPVEVDKAYVDKHDPKAGGYYEVYKGGYKSFCPAKEFEEGNVRINK